MKFCNQCGQGLEERIPDGDDRVRKVCASCATVHYQNPTTIVGCLIEHEDQILLCRRAIEPMLGRWTMPAGFLEIGEGLMAGARRETMEEACADVEITAPHAQLDLPHIGQTYALFRARMKSPDFAPGIESQEVELYAEQNIPWDELAFPVVHHALKLWIDDRDTEKQHMHSGILTWNGQGSRYDPHNYCLEDYLRMELS